MIQSSETQPVVQPRIPRLYLVLAFAAFVLIGANDGAFGVLLPGIRAFYRVDTATLAWVFLSGVLGYLTSTFTSGLLTEKLGQRRFLLLGVALFIAGALLISLGLPFVLYLGSALLLGLGVGMLDAGLNTYIASLPKNATMLNYLHAFYGAGALLGPLVASTLIAWQLGWQATYRTWVIVALLIWVGLWLTFRPRIQVTREVAEGKAGNVLLQALRLRVVWLVAFFLLVYVGVEINMNNWGYSFLTSVRQGSVLYSAWIISGYWCGLTLGRLTLANLGERLGVRPLITLCLLGVITGLLLVWFLPSIWGAAVGFCLTGFFLGPLFPTAIALMPQLIPMRVLPSAIGFVTAMASVGGAAFPSLAGNIVERLGFWTLLPLVLILTLLMSGAWALLQRAPTAKTEEL